MSKENQDKGNNKDNYNVVLKELTQVLKDWEDLKEDFKDMEELIKACRHMWSSNNTGIKIYPNGKWESITWDAKTPSEALEVLEKHVDGKLEILRPAEDIQFVWNESLNQESQLLLNNNNNNNNHEKNEKATKLFHALSTGPCLTETLRGNVVVYVPLDDD